MRITKDILISKTIEEHPETILVFMNHGLACVGCPASTMETIEQGAEVHGLTEEDIEILIKDLNEAIKKN
jgi:hybrid cluster-associated redox disulfide protein